MTSLRERTRRATREAIEDAALTLFRERGYSVVKVEDIAAAVGVSPSTFYRYFGTKEGIFIGLDGDMADLIQALDLDNLVFSLSQLAEQAQWKGMDLVITEPQVRAAVLTWLDKFSAQLAAKIHTERPNTLAVEAAALAGAICFSVYLPAIETWHKEGRERPVGGYFAQALAVARAMGYPHPGQPDMDLVTPGAVQHGG